MEILCAGCGGIVQPGQMFCIYCGRPREEKAQVADSEVLGIFPQAQFCKGFLGLGSELSILVLTPQHLLVAVTPKSMEAVLEDMDSELQESQAESKLDAHEFIKSRDFSQAPWEKYRRRPLRECKDDHPHNRLIEIGHIEKVEVAMYDAWNDDTLGIHLPHESLKFVFWWPWGEMAMEAFQSLLGDKVKNVS